KYQTAIWTVSPEAGRDSLTEFVSHGSSPKWSPNGKALAFITDRDGSLPEIDENEDEAKRDKRCGKGKPQIWIIPAHGGEAHQLSFMQWGVSELQWSPDGEKIVFTAKTDDFPEPPMHDGKPEPQAH